MSRYALSPLAEADLDDIWTYTAAQWGEDQAEAYLRSIQSTIETIADHPQRGAPCDHIRAGYRKFPAAAHVIFYRATAARIEIIRILHKRMEWERRL